MQRELDHIDRAILLALQQNARLSYKELAQQVFLSPPAVAARLRQLEQEGVIAGYMAQVDPVQLGYPIKAFINLEVEPARKQEFYPYIRQVDNVVECNCVTGDYSMLLEGYFKSTMELDLFVGHLQQFGRTKTQIVFSTAVEHRGIPPQELPKEQLD